MGLDEHASVASFARFVLHLMKLGAPPDLLLEAIRAMEDEVHHARLCFGVAARLTGTPASPGELDLSNVLAPADDPVAIVEAAILEGCVNETISARYVGVALERATDPGICRVLARITEDEARHAELAWRFVEWILIKDPTLSTTVRRCFDRALSAPPAQVTQDEPSVLERYGHLCARSRSEVREVVLREVIGPRAQALVGRSTATHEPDRTDPPAWTS